MSATTERLYYIDSQLTEFDARVLDVAETAPGRFAVTLDRTAFYPTGGGQPCDTGTLDQARVVECIDLEAEGVRHLIEGKPPNVGACVTGRVDWTRRLDHTQQHTGQHILSQAFVELFRAPTRGFRMLERVSEIDVELSEPSPERVEQAVDLANRIVWEDRPVRTQQVTAEEAARLPLRKDSAREGELRIIEIENFDLSPCGGTHAQRTGEVGLIAVRSWERAKGMTRVEFVAGRRALADYRLANHTARAVASQFSVARDESVWSVARLVAENKNLTRRLRTLEETTMRVEVAELIDAQPPKSDGTRIITRIYDERDAESLKRLAQACVAHPRTIALIGSRDSADTARLVFARAADAHGDMNALMREACALVEGRGGGRPELAQGGGRRADKLAEAIDLIALHLATG